MNLNIDKLEELQRILKERKIHPIELLNTFFELLDFKETEIKVYNCLLKREMLVSEIIVALGVSERSIRSHLKKLYEKGFVNRKVIVSDRLKYAYFSVSPKTAWKIVKKNINDILKQVDSVFKISPVFF